ncbi:MAG: hypothetical protein K9G24_06855 [Candidatus Nanopelagicales bacterium]|nr:hypothetical protein [Candidatus Nanopelagicales bacterium]
MTTSPNTWLNELNSYFTPLSAEFDAARAHRDSIEARLETNLGIYRMFEIGSLRHGTGVWLHSDADYLVSLKGTKPQWSNSMLERVRASLAARFQATPITVRRPAVVCHFSDGVVEVVPGYIADTAGGDCGYWIAAPGGDWMKTYPEVHNRYVNDVNRKHGGAAKQLARLLKVWKYERNVPISSCYLEMRAARHMDEQSSYVPVWDVYLVLDHLETHGLAAMNDPTGLGSRFTACSSDATKRDALAKLSTAAGRARIARERYSDGGHAASVAQLELLFDR